MKRLFPRAVPETLIAALLLFGGACSSTSEVKPGAPVLNSLSLIDPNGNHLFDVGPDTAACASNAEGGDCDPGQPVCEIGANVVCLCNAKDMCDPSIKASDANTGGTLSCTFPAAARLLAVFDRLLDTTPFLAKATVATMSLVPPQPAVNVATDYNSAGSTTGFVFPLFFGAPSGPSITVTGNAAYPTASTVSITLDKGLIKAKDMKTPFTGAMLLADGKVAFMTAAFAVSNISVPSPPPPMTAPSAPMACPSNTDGGEDGGTDGGTDGGADAAVAMVPDAGADADVDAGAPMCMDVPVKMNSGAITIVFNNFVDKDVLGHITMTEDGKPFTAFGPPMDQGYPNIAVNLFPTAAWANGKTYAITVDKDAVDVLGASLGAPASATFTMCAE